MYKCYNNYDKCPEIQIDDYMALEGYKNIVRELKTELSNCRKTVIVLDFYPGVDETEVLEGFSLIDPTAAFSTEVCTYTRLEYENKIARELTDDRVFGIMTTQKLEDFFISEKVDRIRSEIAQIESGVILIYGVGAGIVTTGDIYIYCDLARWEIQKRYKNGMPNYKGENGSDLFLSKYKRGFFIEWRIADRHKKKRFEQFDYLLDTNQKCNPKMITGEAFRHALDKICRTPFRTVPYFDPGVWGGQWMREICGIDDSTSDNVAPNYAWSFDGVPEENSLYFRFGDIRVEIPAIDLVFYRPRQLLGERVHARFGDEFPIRFDMLDTMGGGNLSLQVHPLTEYIQQTFGMHYTQDESYYILDSADNSDDSDGGCVFLGLKDDVDKDEMIKDLHIAQSGADVFYAEKYINKFPAKKHDHFLIPAGTIHCSSKDTMVLEISATPYIFTFKLWDWGRVGLDGLPRPIHIEHGKEVICWDRTTGWVKENLINRVTVLSKEVICWDRTTGWVKENLINRVTVLSNENGNIEERTGLHEREFIETRRHIFTNPVLHHSNGSVCMMNLVEGEEAVITSPDNMFEPFTVHYAETFIIPASVPSYIIGPTEKSAGSQLVTIKAYVRG